MPISQSNQQDNLGELIIGASGTDNATAPALSLQVAGKDGSGNLQTFQTDTNGNQIVLIKDSNGISLLAINNQLEVRDVINVASQYQAIALSTTAVEAKGATTRLANRKMVSIIPTNGTIYWATNSSVTTTTGQPIFPNQTLQLSFTDNVTVFIIAAGSVDVRVLEAS